MAPVDIEMSEKRNINDTPTSDAPRIQAGSNRQKKNVEVDTVQYNKCSFLFAAFAIAFIVVFVPTYLAYGKTSSSGADSDDPYATNPNFRITSLNQEYDTSVGIWDWTLASAQLMNTSSNDNKLMQCQVDDDGHPYPAYGFMNIGTLMDNWDEEAYNYSHFTIAWGENMVSGNMNYTVDTTCPNGTDRACCEPFFQTLGGCEAVNAQMPSCPFLYNIMNPSVETYAQNNPWTERNKYGSQFARIHRLRHGKGTACLNANIKLHDLGKDEYNVGLWKVPNASFPALMRLAGGGESGFKDVHDRRARGFTVKVMSLPKDTYGSTITMPKISSQFMGPLARKYFNGETLSFNESLQTDVMDMIAFSTADQKGQTPPVNVQFNSQNPFFYMGLFNTGKNNGPKPKSPYVNNNMLNLSYSNPSAYKLGTNNAMKWYWSPCEGETDKLKDIAFSTDMTDQDLQYTNIKMALDNSSDVALDEYKFCMYLLVQTDPCKENIEDAIQNWAVESILAATLTIPKQKVTYDGWCDATSFHPYRVLNDHLPLGGISRLRNVFYSYTGLYRQKINELLGLSGPESDPYNRVYGAPGRDFPSSEFYPPGEWPATYGGF